MSFRDLKGETFGRLEIIERAPNQGRRVAWKCRCSCDGKIVERISAVLVRGDTRSCGCLFTEARRTHGQSKNNPVYCVWKSMNARCSNPKNPRWKRYGGRSLVVCERWRLSYENFIADMGPRPEGGTIEREDNDLGYFPANCYWGSYTDQAHNKSNNTPFTLNGVTKLAVEWEPITGIPANTIHRRRYRGWSDEHILTTPARPTKRSAARWFQD